MTTSPSTWTRSFLKWPGGKYRLLPTLFQTLPKRPILVEPFVGAGALFLNSGHQHTEINDINPDLINLYRQLKKRGKRFITKANTLFVDKNNRKTTYYKIRSQFNLCDDPLERALLFLYLNRHGFNGLCRYNLKGSYNVPFGDYRRPYFPDAEMHAFHQRLQKVKLYCNDFQTLLKRYLKRNDLHKMLFYCDPPYAPLSKTAHFTGYAASRFTLDDQSALAELAQALMQRGATLCISNHDTPFTRKIYNEAQLHRVNVTRSISCKAKSRGKVKELIAVYDKTR